MRPLREFACPLVVFASVAAFAGWFGTDVPPAVYDDVAAAAGLRPPMSLLPGLWRSFAAPLFALAGLDAGLNILCALGPLALGLSAALAGSLLRALLPARLTALADRTGWGRRIVAAVVLQGVLLFVFSGPVWRTGRFLSPEALTLLLTLAALCLFVRLLRKGGVFLSCVFAVLLGLLAVDTPLAFLVFAAFPCAFSGRLAVLPDGAVVSFASPLTVLLVMRRTTRILLATWVLALAAAIFSFWRTGGAAAEDWNVFQCTGHALADYVAVVRSSATPLGWGLLAVLAAVMLVLPFALAPRALDDERFLPYRHGLFFLFVGAFACLPCAGGPSCAFGRWGGGAVSSPYLQGLAVLGCAFAATVSMGVLGMDLYFRNKLRIVQTRYPDSVADDPVAAHMAARIRVKSRLLRVLFAVEPFVAAAFLAGAPGRSDAVVRGMEEVVNACARGTAAECGDARLIVTDGALDAAVEVCATRAGRTLHALSLMSGPAPRDVYVRRRAALDKEDDAMLAAGAYETLRTWVSEKPFAASNIAVQVGAELWRHRGVPPPTPGGFTGRTARPDAAGRAAAVADARAEAEKALALCARGAPDVADAKTKDLFEFVLWRLARMARWRADAADAAGDTARALAETTLADRLDACNGAYQRIERGLSWLGRKQGQRLTPREGLAFALARADFRMAHAFARQVMLSEPDNLQANFAAGMDYLSEESYGRAERHFRAVLRANPREPAALNNLAVALLRQGRTAEAETNAVRALELHPASPEVKATLDEIRRVRKLENARAAEGQG